MELHGDGIVEEIATKRRGKIDNIRASIVNGQETPTHWRVHFSDGQEPVMKTFMNESELCLVTCPHTGSEPGFYPADPIM